MRRIRLAAALAIACLAVTAAPAAAAGSCPGSFKVQQSGTGMVEFWGVMDGYRITGPRAPMGTPLGEGMRTVSAGLIFTIPAGKTLTYTVRGVKHQVSGPGRWSTHCEHVRRPGTRRTAFLASHIWGGEISLSGARKSFNDAWITTPEGRVLMTKAARVKFTVSRSANRTVARVGSGGGAVYVTAVNGLKNKTPCRTGQAVAIERDGRVHPL